MKNLTPLAILLCLCMQATAQFTFSTGSYFAVGSVPLSVCSADFNNDGKLDFATGNSGTNNISIRFGNGLGSFGSTITVVAGTGINGIGSADFNNDGKMDLAYINPNLYSVSVRLGNGSGGFGTAANRTTGVGPNALTCADFNNDGNMDLATANSNTISVMMGNGTGALGTAVNYTAGNQVMAIINADLNNDGKKDIAAANLNSNSISVFINNGLGGFAAAVNYTVASGPDGLTSSDFNGDGNLDLASSNYDYNNVSVQLGNGLGGFAPAVIFYTGSYPLSITSADYNGDGKADIATANPYADSISVLAGNGLGGFSAPQHVFIAGGPYSILSGDYNGDGAKDILTANYVGDNVCLLLNNTGFTITATAGSHGSITPAGSTSVSIGGSQAYSISPQTCYHISDVLVDGVSIGPVSTYTFTGVIAAHTISASFLPNLITGSSAETACTSYTWLQNSNATYTVSGIYTQTFTTVAGCDSVHTLNLTIGCNSILNLKVYLQGYYTGNNLMVPTLYNAGLTTNNTLADSIAIELHNTLSPYAMVMSKMVVLQTNGNASINLGPISGNYYIALRHRSSLLTWSAVPVLLSNAAPVTYDFTDAANKSFGDNAQSLGSGVWGMYTGDLNGDENIDLIDMLILENDITIFASGYLATDLNGDGNIDLLDSPILEDNISSFVYSLHP